MGWTWMKFHSAAGDFKCASIKSTNGARRYMTWLRVYLLLRKKKKEIPPDLQPWHQFSKHIIILSWKCIKNKLTTTRYSLLHRLFVSQSLRRVNLRTRSNWYGTRWLTFVWFELWQGYELLLEIYLFQHPARQNIRLAPNRRTDVDQESQHASPVHAVFDILLEETHSFSRRRLEHGRIFFALGIFLLGESRNGLRHTVL